MKLTFDNYSMPQKTKYNIKKIKKENFFEKIPSFFIIIYVRYCFPTLLVHLYSFS